MAGSASVAGAAPEAAGRVVSVQVSEVPHRAPAPQHVIRAIPDMGIHGDRHASPRSPRQVLVVEAGTLRALGLRPGDLREQVTVDHEGLHALAPGTRLEMGEAVLRVTGPCSPCTHIGEDLAVENPEGLRRELEGRRGVLASVESVVGEGRIRPGDRVGVLEAAEVSEADDEAAGPRGARTSAGPGIAPGRDPW